MNIGSLLAYKLLQALDQPSEEFTEFHLLYDHDIPQNVWERATVVEEEEELLWNGYCVAVDTKYKGSRLYVSFCPTCSGG